MTASTKLHQLESKISDLQTQHQLLLKERQQEISILLSSVDLAHLEDKTLLGVLLFIRDKITTQDPILETWQDVGEKFLRRTKPKSHPREGGKQKEERPQITSGNLTPSKQTAASQTTHQSPQKQPRQGDE